MHALIETIHRYGGLAATHELLATGATKHSLALAVHHDIIIRVRQGWYCTPDIHPLAQQGIRVGGRLGCVSSAALHGMWAPPGENLHVSLDHSDCRLRTPTDKTRRLPRSAPGVTAHWNSQPRSGSRLLLDPISSLAEVIRCQPIEFTVAVADSGLRPIGFAGYPLISPHEWQSLIDCFPGRHRQLQLADGICESGTESIAWVRFVALRIPLERQVWIDGMRVDFLIGRRLVVEVDGAAYHIDSVRFEADRRRDAYLCVLDYIVLRFSYNQVIYRWHEVEAAVLAAVARGDHR
jgi:very-short-patch-repair endonuclease